MQAFFVLIFCGIFFQELLAQQEIGAYCSDSTYCIPSIKGALRPKGAIYKTEYGEVRFKDGNDEVKALNRLTSIKLKIPIILQDRLRIVAGLFHYSEDFSQVRTISGTDALQNTITGPKKDFMSNGINFYLLKPYLGGKYLSIRTSTSFAGPIEGPANNYFKTSVSFLIGKKKDEGTITGWGGALRYSMGRFFPLPLFYYIKDLSPRMSMELKLPLANSLRWKAPNQKTAFILDGKFSGGRYRLQNEGSQLPDEIYSSTDWNTTLTLEREIYDFLWFNVYAGHKVNILSNTFESDYVIRRGIIYGFSVFIVPPRKFKF